MLRKKEFAFHDKSIQADEMIGIPHYLMAEFINKIGLGGNYFEAVEIMEATDTFYRNHLMQKQLKSNYSKEKMLENEAKIKANDAKAQSKEVKTNDTNEVKNKTKDSKK